MTKWYNVGKIVNTQGIRGEVRVISTTDFKEERYKIGNTLAMFLKDNEQIDVEIASYRTHKNFDIISFKGFNNINDVEKYKGSILKVSEAQLGALEENEFYYHEIIGCKVQTEAGEEIGTISEVLSPGANDVWVVKRKGEKDALIPYIESVVLRVDVDNKEVVIRPLEGLLE